MDCEYRRLKMIKIKKCKAVDIFYDLCYYLQGDYYG